MTTLPQAATLPGGVVEAQSTTDTLPSRAESPSRRFFESQDWSQRNGGGIVVRNTFIDVCPISEDSDNPSPGCESPTQRRNLSAPPSPSRSRHPLPGNEDVGEFESEDEEEDDPGAIPSYQWAPGDTLLKAEQESDSQWFHALGSPKKVNTGKQKNMTTKGAGIIARGMSLGAIHSGEKPPAFSGLGLMGAIGPGRDDEVEEHGGPGVVESQPGGPSLGLSSIFGQSVGLGALAPPAGELDAVAGHFSGFNATAAGFTSVSGFSSLGSFGTAAGGIDPPGLSTAPPVGYPLEEAFNPNSSLGMPGPSIFSGFDSVGLGSLGHSLAGGPAVDPLMGCFPTGLLGVDPLLGTMSPGFGQYGGYPRMGRDMSAPPDMPAPPAGPPSLNMGAQVLSDQRLSTAPLPTSSVPPPSAPPTVEPASTTAFISDSPPPPRMPLGAHISTEAPAYVLRAAAAAAQAAATGNSVPLPPPPVAPNSVPICSQPELGQVAGGSRRSSVQSLSACGRRPSGDVRSGSKSFPGELGGMLSGDGFSTSVLSEGMISGDGFSTSVLSEGGMNYLGSGIGASGPAADPYGEGAYIDNSPYALGQGRWSTTPGPPPPPAHGVWVAPGAVPNIDEFSFVALGRGGRGKGGASASMEDLSAGGVNGTGRGGRNKGGGRGHGKNQRPESVGPPAAGGGERETKGRVPLSGGGPKRTDYIKKYGGVPETEAGDVVHGGGGQVNAQGVPITTMMLKNIPCRKGQEEVMLHIDQKGFGNRYDFFYLPRDVKFRANLGYAFINFLTPEDAENFSKEMNGYRFSSSGSMKACAVVPAHVQGLMNNLAAFKRTEVMRSSRRPYFSTTQNV